MTNSRTSAKSVLTPDDLLGLSEFARQQPDVIAKAQSLEADRSLYAIARQRLVAKGHFDWAEAEKAENGFLQFALLVAVTGQSLSPSGLADEFWHEFLMDTPTYSAWSERHFGRFFHHRPEPIESLEKRGVLQRSRALYVTYFDEDRRFAHCANGHSCHGNCTVHQQEMATCNGSNCGNA
jgi:hypothetical protein